jgi:hypothetical protein
MKSDVVAELGVLTVLNEIAVASAQAEATDLDHVLPMCAIRSYPLTRLVSQLHVVPRFAELTAVVVTAPELRILEALAMMRFQGDVFIAAHPSVPDLVVNDLARNFPVGLRGGVLRVPAVPRHALAVGSTALLTVGFDAGCMMTLVPVWTAEALLFWRSIFLGPSILLDPTGAIVHDRPSNWVTVTTDGLFSGVVRGNAGSMS